MVPGAINVGNRELSLVGADHFDGQATVGIYRAGDGALGKAPGQQVANFTSAQCVHNVDSFC
ncbi:hypothetical protein EMIT0P260_40087 [Pseudomonas sp. IT-P260]